MKLLSANVQGVRWNNWKGMVDFGGHPENQAFFTPGLGQPGGLDF